MDFFEFERESEIRQLWDLVTIARSVPYSLFTFGTSDLEYFLVVDADQPGNMVGVSRGAVKVTRPLIITPDNAQPELRNFFEEGQFGHVVDFLLSRTAAFSNLKLENYQQKTELVSDSVDEVVGRLNRRLDQEEEDAIAILTSPHGLGGLAVFKYTAARIIDSAPGNIRELRERGFLPER